MTRLLRLRPADRGSRDYQRDLEDARRVLLDGGVIAFPTDTVWGIGALADRAGAIDRLYAAKGRDLAMPIACLVADSSSARPLARAWPARADELAARFWPGGLTLVIPTEGAIFPAIQREKSTLGVRVPRGIVLSDLLTGMPVPLAATSANLSGQPPLATLAEVERAFGEAVDRVIDTEESPDGLASTVVEVSEDGVRMIRQGSVRVE